jgi:ribosomal protein L11 methyltransferase
MNLTWLEISLIVDGEMAEAVSEVLSRYAPDGVVIESTQIKPDLQGEGQLTGPLRIYAYLPNDQQVEQKRKSLEEALWHLGTIRPLSKPQFRFIEQADWAEAWKQHFQPIEIGQRLMIVPAWLEPPDQSRVVVRIDPGMAFGTGTHPSTQLCLEMIEEWIASNQELRMGDSQLGTEDQKLVSDKGIAMIDVGCGSGILAIAALKLGVPHALGVDVDPQAIIAARRNAQSNDIAEQLELRVSSLPEVLAGHFYLKQASLVAVNILAPVLVGMLEEGLSHLLTRDGRLILAGILEEQAEQIISAAEGQGLSLLDKRQMGDWVALGFEY